MLCKWVEYNEEDVSYSREIADGQITLHKCYNEQCLLGYNIIKLLYIHSSCDVDMHKSKESNNITIYGVKHWWWKILLTKQFIILPSNVYCPYT